MQQNSKDLDIMEENGIQGAYHFQMPSDLNPKALLQSLKRVIRRYGIATERNEVDFSIDVDIVLAQVGIYDNLLLLERRDSAKHSEEAIELVKKIIHELEEIPDGCAECFPFETIEKLKKEYL